MSTALRYAAGAPTWALTAPPLFLAIALGLTGHHLRTRRTTR